MTRQMTFLFETTAADANAGTEGTAPSTAAMSEPPAEDSNTPPVDEADVHFEPARVFPAQSLPRRTAKRGSVRLTLDAGEEAGASADDVALAIPSGLPTTLLGCMALAEQRRLLPQDDLDRIGQGIRLIARIAKVPVEEILADPASLRAVLARTTPTATRSPAKPLFQARAAIKGLLAAVGIVSGLTLRIAPTSGAWAELLARAGSKTSNKGLPPFARFAAARGVLPEQVDAATFAAFEAFLLHRSLEPDPRVVTLGLAKCWERLRLSLPFWPQQPVMLAKRMVGRQPLQAADRAAGIKVGSIRLSNAAAPSGRTPVPEPVLAAGETRAASLAECLALCTGRDAVPARRLKGFQSAVTALERILDRPAASIPAAPRDLRPLLGAIMPAGHGISEARWRNIRSDLKALLIVAGWVSPLSHRTATLAGPWAELLLAVAQDGPVRTMPPFARWCAAEGILPEAVVRRHAKLALWRHEELAPSVI
jgi:hypothetical protein